MHKTPMKLYEQQFKDANRGIEKKDVRRHISTPESDRHRLFDKV